MLSKLAKSLGGSSSRDGSSSKKPKKKSSRFFYDGPGFQLSLLVFERSVDLTFPSHWALVLHEIGTTVGWQCHVQHSGQRWIRNFFESYDVMAGAAGYMRVYPPEGQSIPYGSVGRMSDMIKTTRVPEIVWPPGGQRPTVLPDNLYVLNALARLEAAALIQPGTQAYLRDIVGGSATTMRWYLTTRWVDLAQPVLGQGTLPLRR